MDLPVSHTITHAHHGDDRVTLSYDDRFLRRKVLETEGGVRFLVDLAQTTSLGPGDAFRLEDGRLIEVVAAAEELARNPRRPHAARLAHRQPPHALPDRARPPADPARPRASRHAGEARGGGVGGCRAFHARRRGLRSRTHPGHATGPCALTRCSPSPNGSRRPTRSGPLPTATGWRPRSRPVGCRTARRWKPGSPKCSVSGPGTTTRC